MTNEEVIEIIAMRRQGRTPVIGGNVNMSMTITRTTRTKNERTVKPI